MEQQCVIEPRNYGSKYMVCFEINMSTATLKMDFIIRFFLQKFDKFLVRLALWTNMFGWEIWQAEVFVCLNNLDVTIKRNQNKRKMK